MSGEAERPWWATNGESFVVRDLSMHSNVTRRAKPEKNPEKKFFYVDTSDWSIFEASHRSIMDKRGFQFITEAGQGLTAAMQSDFDAIQNEFRERWDELDKKVLAFVHAAHLDSQGLEVPTPSFTVSSNNKRVTYCWFCKTGLDGSVDVSCVACRWILCGCGACGCGYQGRYY